MVLLLRAALAALLAAVALSAAASSAGAAVLAGGNSHTCSAASGAALCWGSSGDLGALGAGPATRFSYDPVGVSGLGGGVSAIATGSYSGCAVQSGAAKCWGWNDYGQVGDGAAGGKRETPVQVVGLTSGVTQIATTAWHVCAVQSGAAKCWGDNGGLLAGALGYSADDNQDQPAPVQVAGLTSGVTDVAAGGRHSCAIQNGAAKCWGDNTNGQLGYGSCTPASYDNKYRWTARPVCDFPAGRTATRIVAGTDLSCAVLDDGSAWCWGYNNYGQLGNGSTQSADRPQQVLASGVTDISAADSHVCAVQNGAVKCWGWNQRGQLGNGTAGNVSATPVAATGLESGVTAVAVGSAHSCALKAGTTYCWGTNQHAELGNEAVGGGAYVPVPVTGRLPAAPGPAPATPAAPVVKTPAPVTPQPPARPKAELVTSSAARKLDRKRRAAVVTVSCPSGGAACRLSVPATARVKIGRKAYTAKISAPRSVAAGRKATVRVTLSRAAAQRLRGRRGTVSVRVQVTSPGGTVTRTVPATVRR